jgi:hypothetical protein
MPALFKKKVLFRTLKGSSAPIGETFEEPLLVAGSRKNSFGFHVEPFFTEGSTWNPKGFYLEPKKVLLWGQPKNPFGTLFSPRVCHWYCLENNIVNMLCIHLFEGTFSKSPSLI